MLGKHDKGSPVTQASSGNVICIKQSEFSDSKSKDDTLFLGVGGNP